MTAFIRIVAFFQSPGLWEMVVIFGVILMLFGSKNVPKIARNIGKSLEELRKATREVKDEIMRADYEADQKVKALPEKDAVQRGENWESQYAYPPEPDIMDPNADRALYESHLADIQANDSQPAPATPATEPGPEPASPASPPVETVAQSTPGPIEPPGPEAAPAAGAEPDSGDAKT